MILVRVNGVFVDSFRGVVSRWLEENSEGIFGRGKGVTRKLGFLETFTAGGVVLSFVP